MSITPFTVYFPDPALEDLRARLANPRWPDEIDNIHWEYGTNLNYLKTLVQFWHDQFNWRAQEIFMNRFSHFKTDIDGTGIHFIHEHGKGEKPLPIILTHGFPDSFLRFSKIIPMLTNPAAHGGAASDSFDVVVPSIPGYGFSDKPAKPGMLFKIGDLWAKLMKDKLGYEHFAAHGGDWGSTITAQLAHNHASSVVGIHLTNVPFSTRMEKPSDLSDDEKKMFAKAEEFLKNEGAYAMIQGTKPQTLSYGLNDSPTGLAAWIVEKFRDWSDCAGDVETRFTKDELLANITLYWLTETINSSFRMYYDSMHPGAVTGLLESFKKMASSSKVPTAVASFPRDLVPSPREWAERWFNVQRFTEMPRGGHFAALEEPELLVADIREFFRPLRRV